MLRLPNQLGLHARQRVVGHGSLRDLCGRSVRRRQSVVGEGVVWPFVLPRHYHDALIVAAEAPWATCTSYHLFWGLPRVWG